jgi:glutathione reductase (NADPH)
MTQQYDLVVIGGGSGGLAAAQRAAEYGARVALVEKGRLGGTCVNVGCVPKKIMWTAASLGHALADAREYGFSVDPASSHDWAGLCEKREAYLRRLNEIYDRNLRAKEIHLVRGVARLVGPSTVRVAEEIFQGRHIVLANGGQPTVPDLPGAALGITSDGFFALSTLPRRVAVIGSGYVAVELSGVLSALGAEVTVFARYDSLLRSFDELLQASVIQTLQNHEVTLRWRSVPEAVERHRDGLRLHVADGTAHGPFDALLWAVGRSPATRDLGLETAGVASDETGFIRTDRFQNTNVANIHAIGDVTGREALTPVAIAAGRRLSDRLFGGMTDRHLDYEYIPTVIFSHPPLGTCGLSEQQARQRHGDAVQVFQSEFVPLYHAMTSYKPKARVKLVTAGPEHKVIGCHLFGPGADEILQGFAVAMRMGATKRDFDDTVAIHPTLAEELVTLR